MLLERQMVLWSANQFPPELLMRNSKLFYSLRPVGETLATAAERVTSIDMAAAAQAGKGTDCVRLMAEAVVAENVVAPNVPVENMNHRTAGKMTPREMILHDLEIEMVRIREKLHRQATEEASRLELLIRENLHRQAMEEVSRLEFLIKRKIELVLQKADESEKEIGEVESNLRETMDIDDSKKKYEESAVAMLTLSGQSKDKDVKSDNGSEKEHLGKFVEVAVSGGGHVQKANQNNNLEQVEMLENVSGAKCKNKKQPPKVGGTTKKKPRKVYGCDLCQVVVLSEQMYNNHLLGKRHKKAVERQENTALELVPKVLQKADESKREIREVESNLQAMVEIDNLQKRNHELAVPILTLSGRSGDEGDRSGERHLSELVEVTVGGKVHGETASSANRKQDITSSDASNPFNGPRCNEAKTKSGSSQHVTSDISSDIRGNTKGKCTLSGNQDPTPLATISSRLYQSLSSEPKTLVHSNPESFFQNTTATTTTYPHYSSFADYLNKNVFPQPIVSANHNYNLEQVEAREQNEWSKVDSEFGEKSSAKLKHTINNSNQEEAREENGRSLTEKAIIFGKEIVNQPSDLGKTADGVTQGSNACVNNFPLQVGVLEDGTKRKAEKLVPEFGGSSYIMVGGLKKKVKQEFICDLCQVRVFSEQVYNRHLFGKRHKRLLQKS